VRWDYKVKVKVKVTWDYKVKVKVKVKVTWQYWSRTVSKNLTSGIEADLNSPELQSLISWPTS
jgi:hypothetical protein